MFSAVISKEVLGPPRSSLVTVRVPEIWVSGFGSATWRNESKPGKFKKAFLHILPNFCGIIDDFSKWEQHAKFEKSSNIPRNGKKMEEKACST